MTGEYVVTLTPTKRKGRRKKRDAYCMCLRLGWNGGIVFSDQSEREQRGGQDCRRTCSARFDFYPDAGCLATFAPLFHCSRSLTPTSPRGFQRAALLCSALRSHPTSPRGFPRVALLCSLRPVNRKMIAGRVRPSRYAEEGW